MIRQYIENNLLYGGWGQIRTHGGLSPSAVFKTAALNHSATHPFKFLRQSITNKARDI